MTLARGSLSFLGTEIGIYYASLMLELKRFYSCEHSIKPSHMVEHVYLYMSVYLKLVQNSYY